MGPNISKDTSRGVGHVGDVQTSYRGPRGILGTVERWRMSAMVIVELYKAEKQLDTAKNH